MRLLLACLLALLLAPEARADSWVPADPPEGDVAQISVSDGTAAASSQDGTSSPLSVSVRSPAGA